MPTFEDTQLRDLMDRATADLDLPDGLATRMARRATRRRRQLLAVRAGVAGVVAAGVATTAVAANGGHSTNRTAGHAPGAPGAPGAPAPVPAHLIAYRTLTHLASVAAAAPAAPARYVTMVDAQADSASGQHWTQTTVWDGATGDVRAAEGGHTLADQPHGSMTEAQLAALPTNPAALRSTLLSQAKAADARSRQAGIQQLESQGVSPGTATAENPPSPYSDAALIFQQDNLLLYNPLVPPTVRAALLDTLTTIPGVQVDTGTHDGTGRPATEITLHSGPVDGESYVQSTYLDPATTTVLEETQTLTNLQSGQADTTSDIFVSVKRSDTRPAL